MSNGPYGLIACDCGALSLLVGGSPLALGLDTGDEPVAFWPLAAIQIGQGADELDVSADDEGGDAWGCRRCGERLLYAHDGTGIAILQGHPEDRGDLASGLTLSQQCTLEALGYRVLAGE